jgi:hybrid cluster-associated redox disulfide protein
METTLDASWTVDQVLKTYPQAIPVFLSLKLGCVGCYLERFCSLAEVAASYKLSTEFLLAQLSETIQLSPERGE